MGILCCCCCFNNLPSKKLELIMIIFNCFSILFILCSLIIIKWSKISYANLVIFLLMLIIIIISLIIIIFLRLWRTKNIIKTSKKSIAKILSTTCALLTVLCFIICGSEVFLISIQFSYANYPCQDNEDNNSLINEKKRKLNDSDEIDCSKLERYYYTGVITLVEYLISYFTLSYLLIVLFLGLIICMLLKKRIILRIDGPVPLGPIIPTTQHLRYNQYGRQVIVVQPGDVFVLGNNKNQGNNSTGYQYNIEQSQSQNIPPQNNNSPFPESQENRLQVKQNAI